MDDTGNITQNREQNVDEQVCAATTFEEDTKRWEDDGEDDLDDVAVHSVSFCTGSQRLRLVALFASQRMRVNDAQDEDAYLPVNAIAIGSLWLS